MSITKTILLSCLLVSINTFAQDAIKMVAARNGVSLRGLCIANKKVIWASGTNGSIAKSVDEGNTFEWVQVKGYEHRDFRSIYAWNDQEAIIVAIAAPAIILKTKDGGNIWEKVYENNDTAMFLDAIYFKDANNGIVVGDPIKNVPFILKSTNAGSSWSQIEDGYFVDSLQKGEAFFASSNTNIAHSLQDEFLITGGLTSRLWINGKPNLLPIVQGLKSTGANSIAVSPDQNYIAIIGGDFANDTNSNKNFVLYQKIASTKSSGNNYSMQPLLNLLSNEINTIGYKSCIKFIDNQTLIACGTSGIAISKNRGHLWEKISTQGFHTLQKQPFTNKVFFAGRGGRIAYLTL